MTSDDKGPYDGFGSGARRVAEISLPAGPGAPALARRLVTAAADRTPSLRLIDLALLTSELVSLGAGTGGDMKVGLLERGRQMRVTVSTSEEGTIRVDDLTRPILERLASRWGEDEDSTWFEIEWLSARTLTTLDEPELFALLPDNAARAEIFERYAGFSLALARRFTRSAVAFDDLEQVASLALVKAIDRFQPDLGHKFTTFAGETIKGELKRHMRDTAWSVRVPRTLQEASVAVRRAEHELEQRLGRQPTPEEIAEATSLEPDLLEQARGANQAFSATSIDAPLRSDTESITLASVLGVDDKALDQVEAWHAVEAAMNRLSERERRILYLRFFEDLSQSEIAEAVGVSQMHVSRLLTKAIGEIREAMGVGPVSES